MAIIRQIQIAAGVVALGGALFFFLGKKNAEDGVVVISPEAYPFRVRPPNVPDAPQQHIYAELEKDGGHKGQAEHLLPPEEFPVTAKKAPQYPSDAEEAVSASSHNNTESTENGASVAKAQDQRRSMASSHNNTESTAKGEMVSELRIDEKQGLHGAKESHDKGLHGAKESHDKGLQGAKESHDKGLGLQTVPTSAQACPAGGAWFCRSGQIKARVGYFDSLGAAQIAWRRIERALGKIPPFVTPIFQQTRYGFLIVVPMLTNKTQAAFLCNWLRQNGCSCAFH